METGKRQAKKSFAILLLILVLSPAYKSDGDVIALMLDPPTKYAHDPVPFSGAEDVPVNTDLKWRNGDGVVKHDLYLGTNFNDVSNADRNSPALIDADLAADANAGYDPYSATGFLKLDTTYYWRVDENTPPYVYEGEVWSFTTLAYSVVDNFNKPYGASPPSRINDTWKDYWTQLGAYGPKTSAQVLPATEPNHGGAICQLKYRTDINVANYDTEVPTIFGVDSASGQLVAFDPWTGAEIKRANLPSISPCDTDIGLAGSQDNELYYINGDYENGEHVYVLDPFDASIIHQFQINTWFKVAGLGYQSSTPDSYLYTSGCGVGDMHRYIAEDGADPEFYWTQSGPGNAVGGDDYGRIFAPYSGWNGIFEADPFVSRVVNSIPCDFAHDIVGMAYDGAYLYASTRDNRVYIMNADTGEVINETQMGYTLYALAAIPYSTLTLEKVDDVNDGDYVGPGDDVNYTIYYSYPMESNIGVINDVNIIDELPEEVRFISADSNGTYDRCLHTVRWNLDTLSPGESGCVTLKVQMKCAGCDWTGSIIKNCCAIKSVGQTLGIACESTPKCYASDPSPRCGTDVLKDVVLGWRQGPKAVTHDVYLGTDRSKVANADRSNPMGVLVNQGQDSNTYDSCGLLETNQCYYWRIDEVNDANIWRGGVWHFRIGADDTTLVGDGPPYKSMQYWYRNNLSPYYSEARADLGTGADKLNIDPNWLGMDAKALVLWFYGRPTNDANEKMYVTVTDGNTPTKMTGKVIYDGDMNDIRKEEWQEWNIDLQDFVDANNVNLTNVSRITIGFGDGTTRGTGTVYFDDIRLYNRRCIPELFEGDLDCDCVVNFRDFAILANEWLETGCCEADLYKDNKVDFNDLAILVDNWLKKG